MQLRMASSNDYMYFHLQRNCDYELTKLNQTKANDTEMEELLKSRVQQSGLVGWKKYSDYQKKILSLLH